VATKLYLRDAAPANDPGETENSTALPVGTFKDGAFAPESLSTTKGTVAIQRTLASLSQTAHQDVFWTSFSSAALAAQTIDANTWTIAARVAEGNNAANAFTILSVYVFREPSTIVGFIYDSDTPLGNEWNGGLSGRVATFSGSAVTASASDYLVLEFWAHSNQSMAMSYDYRLRYDGTVDATEGGGGDASYLETPQNLTFNGGGPTGQPTQKRWGGSILNQGARGIGKGWQMK